MKNRQNESYDKYDGHKSIKKLKRIKDRHEVNQKIKNITDFKGDEDGLQFQSREKFRR
jgi:hypothetical protein